MTQLQEELGQLEVKKGMYYVRLKLKTKVLIRNFRSLKMAKKIQGKLLKEGMFAVLFDKGGNVIPLLES